MKPVKLFGRIMKNSTRANDIIVDNFGGSGTTIMAAEQLTRTCYMMELDPIYCDVIIKRWEEYTGEQAEPIGNFIKGNTE
jgi:DNA modification methylase